MSILAWALVLLSAELAPVHVTLQAAPGLTLDPEQAVLLVVERDGNEAMPPALSVPPTRVAQEQVLWLPARQSWEITCRGEGIWCPTVEVEAGSGPGAVLLPAWPGSTLRARLESAEPRTPQPSRVVVQGGFAGRKDGAAFDFSQVIPITEGRFELRIPQDLLDLRLAAEGFGPLYLWDLDARGKRSVSLPAPLRLWPGSSLCGWVRDEETGAPMAGVQVKLKPPKLPDPPDDATGPKLERLALEATSNARGFFQLPGAAAGTYRLELHDPEGARPVGVVEPLELRADSETCLEDLALGRFLSVRLVLSPARDPLDRPWRVELWPKEGATAAWETEASRETDEAGTATYTKVAPGTFSLHVYDGDKRSHTVQFLKLTEDGDVPISVDTVLVDGRIRLHREPLVAKITLWSTLAHTFTSDAEGRFHGLMLKPRFPFFNAEIDAEAPPIHRRVLVEEAEPVDGVIKVELELEGSAIEGNVATAAGGPVAGATVGAGFGEGLAASTITDEGGRFRLDALPNRIGRLSASHPEHGESELVQVDPSATGAWFTLVLRPRRELHGRVVSARQEPVPGAEVSLLIPQAVGGTGIWARTDFQGRFEEKVPKEARLGVAVVRAPTELLWSGCVTLPEEGELEIRLPPGPSSTLRLETRFEPDPVRPPADEIVIATAEGGLITSEDLAQWNMSRTQDLGDRLVEPGLAEMVATQVAAGRYAAFRTNLSSWALAQLACSGQLAAGEEWQTLAPGGEVVFRIDRRKPLPQAPVEP